MSDEDGPGRNDIAFFDDGLSFGYRYGADGSYECRVRLTARFAVADLDHPKMQVDIPLDPLLKLIAESALREDALKLLQLGGQSPAEQADSWRETARQFCRNADFWRKNTNALWMLLDEISTMDDACKSDDAAFRKVAYGIAEQRHDYMGAPEEDDADPKPGPTESDACPACRGTGRVRNRTGTAWAHCLCRRSAPSPVVPPKGAPAPLPDCECCGSIQTKPGALVFSPPNPDGQCHKSHVCADVCWEDLCGFLHHRPDPGGVYEPGAGPEWLRHLLASCEALVAEDPAVDSSEAAVLRVVSKLVEAWEKRPGGPTFSISEEPE